MYDAGVTGNKSGAWTSIGSLTEQVLTTGTKLSSSVYADCYYKANPLLTGDFEVTFDLADGYAWQYMFTLLDANNNKIDRVIGYNASNSTKQFTVFNASYTVLSHSTFTHTLPVTCKLVREGSDLKFYEDNNLKTTTTISTSDCYFAFIEHSDANRYTTFKDLKIKGL